MDPSELELDSSQMTQKYDKYSEPIHVEYIIKYAGFIQYIHVLVHTTIIYVDVLLCALIYQDYIISVTIVTCKGVCTVGE